MHDGKGLRYNEGKAPLDFLPAEILGLYFDVVKAPESTTPVDFMHMLHAFETDEVDAAYFLSFLTYEDLEGAARVFQYVTTREVKPYPAWNWTRGMAWSIPNGCIKRHALEIESGHNVDPETGFQHRFHIACNVIMLAYYVLHGIGKDDRMVTQLKEIAA